MARNNDFKYQARVFAPTVLIQIAMMLTCNAWLAALVPPLLASVPMGFAILKSDQQVRMLRHKAPNPWFRPMILVCAVGVFLALMAVDLSFKLQLVRALLADVIILSLASNVAVRLHLRARPPMAAPSR